MQQQKRCLDLDRISHLPDSILTSILSLLPIKESARSSVLSHRWNSLWLSLPFLDLNESLGFNSVTPATAGSSKFDPKRWVSSVNHILLSRSRSHHHHPILRCTISVGLFTEYSLLLGSYLMFLCNRGIKKLTLWNQNEDYYQIPTNVFYCSSLQLLILHRCAIRFPVKFTGWQALKSIKLYFVYLSDMNLDILMSSCGGLESFSLDCCDGFKKIVVRAPKLSKFKFYMSSEISISLEHAPSITCFGISLWCLMRPPDVEDDGYDLFAILMCIPRVEFLNLVYHQEFLEVKIPVVKERIQLPQCLPPDHLLRNLRTLHLSICLNDADLLPILSCLLSSSPNLHELIMNHDPYGIKSETDGAYWERHQVAECMKNHLSYVTLEGVDLNCESVVKFIKFLLMNSCVLKRLVVIYDDTPLQPLSAENDLHRVKWASNNIILKFEPLAW